MGLKGTFISTLLVIDTFFVSFAVGFNQRHVLVVDPKLPAYKQEVKPKALEKVEHGAAGNPDKSGKPDKASAETLKAKAQDKTEKPAGKKEKESRPAGRDKPAQSKPASAKKPSKESQKKASAGAGKAHAQSQSASASGSGAAKGAKGHAKKANSEPAKNKG